jgi:hypothetical protein
LSGGPAIHGVGVAQQRSRVVAYGQRGAQSSWVTSLSISFALDMTGGAWGEVFFTQRSISIAGDSGAPVLLDDASGTVVGLIVGGSPSYSIVQDINYVLSGAAVTFIPSW